MSEESFDGKESGSVESNTTESIKSITAPLLELTDAELIKTVDDLELELIHFELENQIFENFLLHNDPTSITGMAQILEVAERIKSRTTTNLVPNMERRDTTDSLHTSSRRTESVFKFTTTSVSTSERGPRINLTQKLDLVMREMEEMQVSLEQFTARSHRKKCNLQAEIEEIQIRESEVTEAREIFEQKVIIEGVDSLTQRIPAEKFIRYMEEWLRSAESTIEKMRLRTSTLKSLYTKLAGQIVQKEELGEAIDAADFDQLRIENKHLADTIERKNTHLLDLKKTNGTANLVLSTNKKYLQRQVKELTDLKEAIKVKEQQIIELDKESEAVEKSVDKVRNSYESIVELIETYKVPDLLEYIKAKATLGNLKKRIKILYRRNHIDRFALNTCIRQMKKITGAKLPSPSWFKFIQEEVGDEYSLDDEFLDSTRSSQSDQDST